jgi:outer membrane protein assembly factor BamB
MGATENMFGVFGAACVHHALERLFVGLGGYGGMIDSSTTPFARALRWDTLDDAWPTTGMNPPMYSTASPPMYSTAGESGLSSPAIVHDVVFLSTSKPGLYAVDAATGLCLWSAAGLGAADYLLGAAIYGDHVVAGVADGFSNGRVSIYSL